MTDKDRDRDRETDRDRDRETDRERQIIGKDIQGQRRQGEDRDR